MMDSTSIVSTGQAISQVLNLLWPIVASIITYILGHNHTYQKRVKSESKK
jgi:hypothetical protein